MMHRLATLALVTVIAVTAAHTTDYKWTPDALLKVKRVGPVVPSPDGNRTAFVVSEAVMDGERASGCPTFTSPRTTGRARFS